MCIIEYSNFIRCYKDKGSKFTFSNIYTKMFLFIITLYSLIVTGTASSFTALKLGKILVKVLDDFTEKYGTCYFLYSMFVEREDKKDLCVQSSQERVFYDKH